MAAASAVWFITDISSAFGAQIALEALSSGQRVIGTVSRDRREIKAAERVSVVEAGGGKVLRLDVTDAGACAAVWKEAESLYGRVDVLVNSSGDSLLGAVEDLGDDEARTQMETDFFGPLRLIRAALPGFRDRQNGTIVNITSIAGIDGLPSCGLYAASKFALQGLSQSLARETAPFKIHVLLVEPGVFQTDFLDACAGLNNRPHDEEYQTVRLVIDMFSSLAAGEQPGDPAKGAARIVEAVSREGFEGFLRGQVLRLSLGEEYGERFEERIEAMGEDVEKKGREAAGGTLFEKTV